MLSFIFNVGSIESVQLLRRAVSGWYFSISFVNKILWCSFIHCSYNADVNRSVQYRNIIFRPIFVTEVLNKLTMTAYNVKSIIY